MANSLILHEVHCIVFHLT